jgi:hypothetical protein
MSQTINFTQPSVISGMQTSIASQGSTIASQGSQIASQATTIASQGSQITSQVLQSNRLSNAIIDPANPNNLSVPWPATIGNELYANAPSFQQTGGFTKYRAAEGDLDDATRAKIYMGYLRRLVCEEIAPEKALRLSPELASVGYVKKINNHAEYQAYNPYLVYILRKLQTVNINNIPANTDANRNLRADFIMTLNYCTQLVYQTSPVSDVGAIQAFGDGQGSRIYSSYLPGYYGYLAAGNAFFPTSLYSIRTLTGAYNYINQLYTAATGMYKQYLDAVEGYNLGWRKHACQWSFSGWPQGDQVVSLFDSYFEGASNGFLQSVISDYSDYLNFTYTTENTAIPNTNPTRSYPSFSINKNSSIPAVLTGASASLTGAYLTGTYRNIVDNVLLPQMRQFLSFSMSGTCRQTARTDNYPGRFASAPNDMIGDYCYTVDAARCSSYNPADSVGSLIKLSTGTNPNPQSLNDVVNNYLFFLDSSTGTNNVEKLYQVGANFKTFFDDLSSVFITKATDSLTGADLATWNSFTGPNLARAPRAAWLKDKFPMATDREILGRDYGFCVSLTGFNGFTSYVGSTGTSGLIGAYGVYGSTGQYGFTGPDGTFKVFTGTPGAFVDYRDQSLRVASEISSFNANGKPTYIYNKWNATWTGTNINAAFGATGVNYGNMGAYGFHWINLQHNDLAGNLFLDTNIVKPVTTSTTSTYDCFFSYFVEWFTKTYITVNLYANNGARLKLLVSQRCYDYIVSIWKTDMSGMAFCGGSFAGNANANYISSGVLAGKVQCQFEVKYPPAAWADYNTFAQTMLHEFIAGHTLERAVAASRAAALASVSGFERTAISPSSQGEGWAMYAEMFLQEDAGFVQYFDPKTLVLQTGTQDNLRLLKGFINASRIAYRLLCDVGLNYSKYGWDWLTTCQTFLSGDIDAGKAAGFLARMPLYPGQALGYALGCIAILAARRKCEAAALASQSDPNPANRWTFSLQNFNDILLYANPNFTLAVLDEYANQYIANKGGLL